MSVGNKSYDTKRNGRRHEEDEEEEDLGMPVFNTGVGPEGHGPGDDLIVVAMNRAMAEMLADFIDDVDGEIERQVYAFRNSLRHPGDKDPPRQKMGNQPRGLFTKIRGVSGCEIIILRPDFQRDWD